jgi:glycosyltransferase involved in cell wall biosynthesis
MKILAAIPCYNEGLAIGSVVLKARRYVDAVLVVDDGSTDDTREVAQEAGAVVVSHEINKGYGAALRSCFAYAKTNEVDSMVILDGDGQHDPHYIQNLILMKHWQLIII